MTTPNLIRALSGALILASLLLAYYIDIRWLVLTALIGFDILQSAFTGLHPLTWLIEKAGMPEEGIGRPHKMA